MWSCLPSFFPRLELFFFGIVLNFALGFIRFFHHHTARSVMARGQKFSNWMRCWQRAWSAAGGRSNAAENGAANGGKATEQRAVRGRPVSGAWRAAVHANRRGAVGAVRLCGGGREPHLRKLSQRRPHRGGGGLRSARVGYDTAARRLLAADRPHRRGRPVADLGRGYHRHLLTARSSGCLAEQSKASLAASNIFQKRSRPSCRRRSSTRPRTTPPG